MNPAINKLQELILDRRLEHNGNPVMSWMMSNAVILRSKVAGLLRLDRSKSVSRIDGPSALVTGLSPTVGLKPGSDGKKKSVYATRGIISIGDDGVHGYEKPATSVATVTKVDLDKAAQELFEEMEKEAPGQCTLEECRTELEKGIEKEGGQNE